MAAGKEGRGSSLQPTNSHFYHVSPASEGIKMKYMDQSGYFIYTYVRLITIPWLHQLQTHLVYFRARHEICALEIRPVSCRLKLLHEYLCTCHRLGRQRSRSQRSNNENHTLGLLTPFKSMAFNENGYEHPVLHSTNYITRVLT